jgi:hypothetical protein
MWEKQEVCSTNALELHLQLGDRLRGRREPRAARRWPRQHTLRVRKGESSQKRPHGDSIGIPVGAIEEDGVRGNTHECPSLDQCDGPGQQGYKKETAVRVSNERNGKQLTGWQRCRKEKALVLDVESIAVEGGARARQPGVSG